MDLIFALIIMALLCFVLNAALDVPFKLVELLIKFTLFGIKLVAWCAAILLISWGIIVQLSAVIPQ